MAVEFTDKNFKELVLNSDVGTSRLGRHGAVHAEQSVQL